MRKVEFICVLAFVTSLGLTACGPTPTVPPTEPLSQAPATEVPIARVPTEANAAPTATRVASTPSRAVPTPTIVYYSVTERAWQKIPNVVISASKNDQRIALAQGVVDHWNQQLKELGTPAHLG